MQPTHVTVASTKKVWWLGPCGHEWDMVIGDVSNGVGCPFCGGKRVLPGFNDLATTRPELIVEWHPTRNLPLDPTSITGWSTKKVWWLGLCGHEWDIAPQAKRGCRFCSAGRAAVLPGFNDLATRYPDLATEWHPTKNDVGPDRVMPGSQKAFWWLGRCGHPWEMSPNARTSQQQGCPFCSGKRVLLEFNDLVTTHPRLAAEWMPENDRTPQQVTAGSGYSASWRGACGHVWDAPVVDRAGGGQGCPFCAGQRVLSGFNDLASKRPELAVEWHPDRNRDRSPDGVTVSSGVTAWWLGLCGHEWDAPPHRRAKGHGCPHCHVWLTETTLLAELRSIDSSAIGQASIEVPVGRRGRAKCDVLVPDMGLIVEYDGHHWHRHKAALDMQKTLGLLDAGYRVVRVRENNLPLLDVDHPRLAQIRHQYRPGAAGVDRLARHIIRVAKSLPEPVNATGVP